MSNVEARMAEARRRDAAGIPVLPTMRPKYVTWVAWVTAMTTRVKWWEDAK